MAKKKNNTPLIVGGIAGGCLLLCLCGAAIGGFIWLGSQETYDTYSYDISGIDIPAPAEPADVAVAAGSPAAAIKLIPDAGSSTWDAAVKIIMVANYDANGSGAVDSSSEISAVPCDVWQVIDSGCRSKWTYGVRTIYGLDGSGWIGDSLGFDEAQQSTVDSKAAACGLTTE